MDIPAFETVTVSPYRRVPVTAARAVWPVPSADRNRFGYSCRADEKVASLSARCDAVKSRGQGVRSNIEPKPYDRAECENRGEDGAGGDCNPNDDAAFSVHL